jgi:multidrug transporter EmrE-like cation transporter
MRVDATRAWIALGATVVLEVAATILLKASDGFTILAPSVGSIASFVATLFALSIALRRIPTSVAYAVWTGAGSAGVTVLGIVFFGDVMTPLSWIGLVFVVVGVVVINSQQEERTRADQELPE